MARLAIVAGIVLALAAGPMAAYPQDKETAPEDTMAQQAERMGDLSALWEQIKARAVEDPRVSADPMPETPDLRSALLEQIKARAVEDPRVSADPIPETPDLLPGLWEQIKANADELQSKDE